MVNAGCLPPCPQKFAFSHVHKLVSSNNQSMTVGNLVHEIIENIGTLGEGQQERIG